MRNLPPDDVIGLIIKAFYRVYNKLDYGFLESVYVPALQVELEAMGLLVEREVGIPVYYAGRQIGFFRADLFVNRCVIIEVKTLPKLVSEAVRQCRNYLRASNCDHGIVLNFGPRPEFKIEIFTGIHA